MMNDFVETWVKIIQADQQHERETGWSYFDNPEEDNNEQRPDMG